MMLFGKEIQYTLHEITSKTPLVEKHHLGDFNNTCPHCKARYFLSEATQNEKKYTLCCSKGSYSIPHYSHPPTPLVKSLLEGKEGKYSRVFKDNILYINNLVSFASITMKTHPFGAGIPAFRMNGEIYHRIGALNQDKPSHLSAYFVEGDGNNTYNLDKDQERIVNGIREEIKEKNGFIKQLLSMIELEKKSNLPIFQFRLHAGTSDKKTHKGTTNLPSNSMSVGVVLEGTDSDQPNSRDIIIHKKTPDDSKFSTQIINQSHNGYDPLAYVLFHLFGERGFDEDNKWGLNGKSITMRDYYKYIFQRRDEDPNNIVHDIKLQGGRLTHKYACDMYVKIEDKRLSFIRNNQEKLKCDQYKGLMDKIKHDKPSSTSKNVILPSTHVNSPRFFIQNYSDAMAIVRRLGKFLFIFGKWSYFL